MKKISFSLLIGAILVLASCESGSSSGTTETWNDSDSTVNSVHHVHSYPNATSVWMMHHTIEESSHHSSSSYSHPIHISHPVHVSHSVHISHH